jgi:hypothetical protein
MKYLSSLYFYMIYIPIVILVVASFIGYLRVSGDLEVCRLYYREMSRAACFFSSKTVRVPEGK